MTPPVRLDEVDRKLLQLAQDRFPITRRPWAALGRELKLTEEEVLSRLRSLYSYGVVRKIAPVLDVRKIGLGASTLIAMRVPQDRMEEVVSIVNGYRGVTHNYLREHEFNLWFTVTAPSEEELRRTVEEIKRRTGVLEADVLDLPTLRRFKIDVRFRFI